MIDPSDLDGLANAAEAAHAPPEFQVDGPVDDSTTCISCGYSLRGLTADRTCPECGTPVARSVRGDFLCYADWRWLEKLKRGTVLMLVYIIASIVVGCLAGGASQGMQNDPDLAFIGSVLGVIAELAMGALLLASVLQLTTPEPRVAMNEDPLTLRKLVRFCAVIAYVGSVVTSVAELGAGVDPTVAISALVVGGILSLAGIVTFFGLFVYYRRFAMRIPNRTLARQTGTVMWGFVISYAAMIIMGAVFALVLFTQMGGATPQGMPGAIVPFIVGLCAAVIALLVFGIWWIVLLVQYSGEFGRAISQARRYGY